MLRDSIHIYQFEDNTDNYEPEYMFTPDQVEELISEMEERRKEERKQVSKAFGRLFETLGDLFRPEPI